MSREIFCTFFETQLPGLEEPPFSGELGTKIYQTISKHAFDLWIEQQTKLINEYQLMVLNPETQLFLMKEMHSFLFESVEKDLSLKNKDER